MKAVRIAHCSDFHFRPEHIDQFQASWITLLTHVRDNDVDLVVISGDLFDKGVQASDRDQYGELLGMMARLLDLVPVVAVQGTPSHDVPGCYDAFQHLQADHGFVLLDPRWHYILTSTGEIVETDNDDTGWTADEARLLILGMGEPQKGWFLSGQSMGKAESDEAITRGLREILLGLGAIRKEYASLPALMVYHGMVAGASMDNGQTLPPGGIQIGRDDLALVGADYYALGHIHKAQQIGDLPAYYAGSAFPVNWGEVDRKTFEDVEVSIEYLHVTPMPCPHPPRRKIAVDGCDLLNGRGLTAGDLSGYQVWVNVRTDGKYTDAHRESLAENLAHFGALPGSRVTVETIPTETVRAAEIREQKRLRDKVVLWADQSGGDASASLLDKADELEAAGENAGIVHTPHAWRLDSARIRGAIGLWKGTGRDEITIDFADLTPGLVALIGSNGSGKTTLIENLHPFPSMLTRSGKLQDHFRLRDSCRDLTYFDEAGDSWYRFLINIDGANASGSCEYFAYRNGEPLTSGRKAEYDEVVARLFGSLELYQRTAFVSQKPTKGNPDLADATKGEKKALFAELAGIDYFETYQLSARERAKVVESEIERSRGKLEAMEAAIAELPEMRERLRDAEIDLSKLDRLLADAQERGRRLKSARDQIAENAAKSAENQRKIAEIEEAARKLEAEKIDKTTDRALYVLAGKKRGEAEKEIARHEKLKELEEGEREIERTIAKARERIRDEYESRRKAAEDRRQTIRAARDSAQRVLDINTQKKARLLDQIDGLIERSERTVECPECGAEFAPGADDYAQQIAELQRQVFEDADVEIVRTEKLIKQHTAELEGIPVPDQPELPTFDDAKLTEWRSERAGIDIEVARETVRAADEAQARIEAIDERIRDIDTALGGYEHQVTAIKAMIIPGIDVELRKAEAALQEERDEYSRLDREKARVETTRNVISDRIEELEKQQSESEHVRKSIQSSEQDAAEWRVLERACGPDGIPALELDALAPSIAGAANDLLDAAYGARFRVRFDTTRIGGNGSRTRQIEDFLITVTDAESGTTQTLDTLSGGEAVWVKRAIYDAFAAIRSENTGLEFRTCMQDEADGALDPAAREAYVRMLEAAHIASGRRHTMLISHSPEVQQMIGERIAMDELEYEEVMA